MVPSRHWVRFSCSTIGAHVPWTMGADNMRMGSCLHSFVRDAECSEFDDKQGCCRRHLVSTRPRVHALAACIFIISSRNLHYSNTICRQTPGSSSAHAMLFRARLLTVVC